MDELRFGRATLPLPPPWRRLPEASHLGAAPGDSGGSRGEEPAPLPDPAETLAGALSRPLGAPSLATFVEPGDRVVVVVPDSTRRAALEVVLPVVLAAVREAGPSEVAIRIANGTHRRSTAAELSALAALAGGAPVGDRDADDPGAHEALGRFSGGLARIDAEAARADKLVLVGTISFHYLAGFGGGGKLLAPGLADRATALAIHRRCLADPGPGRHPAARPGILAGNPLHGAIGELLLLAPPAFLVQVALRRDGRPAAFFAGAVGLAHAAAAEFHRRHHEVPVGRALDLVVASAGGSPYDLNLYQAHKALEAACRAVRPGGTVVLAAECPEGPGTDAFAEAVARWPTEDAHEAALRAQFGVARHTALALRRKTAAVRCVLVSRGVAPALARALGFTPAADLEEAERLVAARDPGPRAAVLPDGARVLPRAEGAAIF
jgi:nickel-dependent lactate racemase